MKLSANVSRVVVDVGKTLTVSVVASVIASYIVASIFRESISSLIDKSLGIIKLSEAIELLDDAIKESTSLQEQEKEQLMISTPLDNNRQVLVQINESVLRQSKEVDQLILSFGRLRVSDEPDKVRGQYVPSPREAFRSQLKQHRDALAGLKMVLAQLDAGLNEIARAAKDDRTKQNAEARGRMRALVARVETVRTGLAERSETFLRVLRDIQ